MASPKVHDGHRSTGAPGPFATLAPPGGVGTAIFLPGACARRRVQAGPHRGTIFGVGLFLHTPLCELLGIEYPILSVGFGEGAGPELVAAVSNAGGFGVLGGDGLDPEGIPCRIAQVRGLTGRPFGVNLIIVAHDDEDREFRRTWSPQWSPRT